MDLVMYEFDFLNRNVRVTELNIVLAVNYFSNFFPWQKVTLLWEIVVDSFRIKYWYVIRDIKIVFGTFL